MQLEVKHATFYCFRESIRATPSIGKHKINARLRKTQKIVLAPIPIVLKALWKLDTGLNDQLCGV